MRYKFWGVRGSIPTSFSSDKLMSKIHSILQQITPSDLESLNSREKFISNVSFVIT